ncbi:polysaccharide lyase 6 family protein [Cerasicoccus maritimus]|uniref:polysaccharide lyase 6 family protein n=1 Tax=Cerasicoccus maritimus TaxID=490089 RepID=UPI0028525BAB|nr:polysaccharide lyase 6 family protein [Cerasicoccus maritimus]
MKLTAVLCVLLCSPNFLPAEMYQVGSTDELRQLLKSKSIVAGDEIVWADGEYDQVDINLSGVNGEPGYPIVLRAETPGGVVFTGDSRLRIGADHAVVSGFHFKATCGSTLPDKVIAFRGTGGDFANFSRLTNVVIEEADPGHPVLRKSKWVVLYGQFNRVDHCYFSGKRSHDNLMTVYLDESSEQLPAYHQIDHNYFANRADGALAGGTTNGWEIIRIGDSKTSLQEALCRVEANYFERCSGEIEVISNKSGSNVYLGNAFVECSGQLTLRHGFGCLVVDNVFIGSPKNSAEESGVRIVGPDHTVVGNAFLNLDGEGTRGAIVLTEGVRDGLINEYEPVTNALIRANVIIDCRSPIVVGALHGRKAKHAKVNDVPPSSVSIDGNVIVGSSLVFQYFGDSAPGISFSNNVAFTPFSSVEIPWEDEASKGFVAFPLLAADVDRKGIQDRADFIRQKSGPEWR